MKDVRTWLIVVLGFVVGFLALRGPGEVDDPDAELKTEDLIETMTARGFHVYATDPAAGVAERIEALEADTSRLAGLLRQADRDARVRDAELRGVATAHTEAVATIEGMAAVIDSLSTEGEPVSVSTEIEDQTFAGRLQYNYGPQTFDAELRARARFGLTMTEGADGRMIFGVVPEDSRVSAVIESAAWTPPPPVYRCTFRQQLKAGAVGGGIVGTAAAIAALLGG